MVQPFMTVVPLHPQQWHLAVDGVCKCTHDLVVSPEGVGCSTNSHELVQRWLGELQAANPNMRIQVVDGPCPADAGAFTAW